MYTARGSIVDELTQTQAAAWSAFNAAFASPTRDAERAVGFALYQQDISEKLARLDARGAEQDRVIGLFITKKEGPSSG